MPSSPNLAECLKQWFVDHPSNNWYIYEDTPEYVYISYSTTGSKIGLHNPHWVIFSDCIASCCDNAGRTVHADKQVRLMAADPLFFEKLIDTLETVRRKDNA
jgi:hypothetical protein